MPLTDEKVTVNLPCGTKERIKVLASERGLPTSIWIRELILRQLRAESPPPATT